MNVSIHWITFLEILLLQYTAIDGRGPFAVSLLAPASPFRFTCLLYSILFPVRIIRYPFITFKCVLYHLFIHITFQRNILFFQIKVLPIKYDKKQKNIGTNMDGIEIFLSETLDSWLTKENLLVYRSLVHDLDG